MMPMEEIQQKIAHAMRIIITILCEFVDKFYLAQDEENVILCEMSFKPSPPVIRT
jgi:hypothetical protein